MNYRFSSYDKDDIIRHLFHFTDILRDSDVLTQYERDLLDALRKRYSEVCRE